MKAARARVTLATIFLLLVHTAWAASTPLGVATVRSGSAQLNGTAVTLDTTIFSGDSLATMEDGLAVVRLPLGDKVHLGPATIATLQGDRSDLVVSLDRGMVFVHSGNGQRVSVNARGIAVTPAESGSFEVAIQDGTVVVASRQGAVEVAGTNRSFVVPSGKIMKFGPTTETVAQQRTGVGAKAFSPGVGVAIALAVAVPTAILFSVLYANAKAEDACEDAIQSVSPSAPTTQC
ncbi:MAG: hypothetical protein ACRD4D_06635 [Candidatus Acidiferrales bacterium]